MLRISLKGVEFSDSMVLTGLTATIITGGLDARVVSKFSGMTLSGCKGINNDNNNNDNNYNDKYGLLETVGVRIYIKSV